MIGGSASTMMMMWRLVLLLLCIAMTNVAARSDLYYDIVTDVLAGHDYYALLGVDEAAKSSDIRRAYHKLSLQHHPDKHEQDSPAAAAAEAHHLLLTRAYSVLKDDAARGDFNFMRSHGVPLMSRMETGIVRTSRDVSLFTAICIFVSFITAFHWFAKRGQFLSAVSELKSTAKYRKELDALREKRGINKLLRARQHKRDDAELRRLLDDSERQFDASIGLYNARPTWRDMLPVRLSVALYRLATTTRTPAQLEAHNAALRDWSLDEYREHLAQHVLELSRRGELQQFITLANAAAATPVPLLPADQAAAAAADDDDSEQRKTK